MKIEQKGQLTRRTVRSEVACARAMLDELESLVGETDNGVRSDVVVQTADELCRVANVMKTWAERRASEDGREDGRVAGREPVRPEVPTHP